MNQLASAELGFQLRSAGLTVSDAAGPPSSSDLLAESDPTCASFPDPTSLVGFPSPSFARRILKRRGHVHMCNLSSCHFVLHLLCILIWVGLIDKF